MNEFRTELGLNIFKNKYAQNQYETWADRAHIVVDAVAGKALLKLSCENCNLRTLLATSA